MTSNAFLQRIRKVPKVVTALALLCTGGLTVAASQTATAAGTPPDLVVVKTPIANPVAGAFRTTVGWTISWSCASIESPCNNATLTDTLPAGLTLKTVTTAGGLVSSANVSGNSVTWYLETPGTPGVLDAGAVGTLTITAAAPCNAGSDQTFSNTATMNASNATASFTSDPSDITVTTASTCAPPPPPPPTKSSPSRLNAGGRMPFYLTLPYAPSQYDLVDPVPAGLNFQRVSVGAPATVKVSCNGGATYVTVDFASAGPVGSCTKSGGFWNVSHVKFSVPAQTDVAWGEDQNYVSATINTKVPVAAAVGDTFTNTTQTAGPVTSPLTASGTVVGPGPFPVAYKSRYVTPGEPIADWFGDDTHPVVDGDIGYGLTISNAGNSGAANGPLVNPTVTDLLDPNVEFAPGQSWWRIGWIDNPSELVGGGCNTPVFERVANWNGTGRTLLRWKFLDCTFPPVEADPVVHIFLNLRATPGLTAGTSISNSLDILDNGVGSQPAGCDAGAFPDTTDLDGDGNMTESICAENNTDTWIVPKLATIDATKWVNGAADPIGTWTRFPTVGKTAVDADGYAVYHLFLEMKGNIESDRIELIDALPHLGDTSTLNKNAIRKSDWAMELVSQVQVETIDRANAMAGLSAKDQPAALWQPVTSGVTALYSSSDNPCRLTSDFLGTLHIDAALTKPTGCTPNPWTLAEASGAKSFALDIAANQQGYLPASQHGDLLRITVKVKDINEPPAAADLNKVAWNSFAYTVTDIDAFVFLSAEPIKVGVEMTALPATTASLGNYVWWDEDHNGTQNPLEEGINGVTVRLYDGAGNLVQTTVTGPNPAAPNNDGYYRFYGLDPNTTYTVKLDNAADMAAGGPLAGMTLTGTDASGDDTTDNDAALASGIPTIASAPTAAGGSYVPTYDFGFFKLPLYSLGNRVWFDDDNSGNINGGDVAAPGVGNVLVKLLDGSGNPVLDGGGAAITTTTDGSGYYRFDNLQAGDYIVEVAASNFATGGPLQGRIPSTGAAQSADPNTNIDSDDNGLDTLVAGAIRSGVVSLGIYPVEPTSEADLSETGQGGPDKRGNMTVDFGVYTPRYAVGNYVWFDADKNGLQDEANPVSGVVVDLYRADGALVATTTTGVDGKYVFDNLLGGDYYAEFTPPTDYRLTVTTGADATLNSNPDQTTHRTPTFTLDQSLPLVTAADGTLAGTRIDRTIDAGLIPAYTLGNLVWEDFNNNGIADDGEAPIAGVTVDLYLDANSDGIPDSATPFTTTTTGVDGKYKFTNLDAGKYVVQIVSGQAILAGLKTSGTPTPIADGGIDNDNNGVAITAAAAVTAWRSGTVMLGPIGTEPTNEVGGLEAGNPAEDTDAARNNMGDWTIDFGFHRGVRIGNQVWLDGIAGQAGYDDGVFAADGTEPGITGVTVELWSDNGDGVFDPAVDTKVDTTVTGTQGNYWFEHRTPGEKVFVAIKQIPATGTRSSTGISTDANTGDNTDDGAPAAGYLSVSKLIMVPALGASPTGESDAAPIPAVSAETEANAATHSYPDTNSDLRIDFSFVEIPLYRIGNLVWNDTNKDGIATNGETGIAGVKVDLYNGTGTFLSSATTDSSGHYLFTDLVAGDYEVRIPKAQTVLNGYFTSPIDEASANLDGDNNDNGKLAGSYFTAGIVSVGDNNFNTEPTNEKLRADVATDDDLGVGIIVDNHGNLSVDFGFYQPKFSIGNEVWFDKNDNGIRDAAETNVPNGVKVTLLDSSGTAIANTTTTNGLYLFAGLLAGTYSVQLDASNFTTGGLLSGWRSSTPSFPENAIDGDDNGADVASGVIQSPPFTLTERAEPTAETPDNDTVTPDANENLSVDFGVILAPPLSLGNRVWLDSNNNGTMDGTEAPIKDVTVELYLDANGDGIADSGTALAAQVTDANGFYLFTGLARGTYVVKIPKSNFAASGPLAHLRSSDGFTAANDNVDKDDSGVQAGGTAEDVWSKPATLFYYDEPTGETQVGPQTDATGDDSSNLTVDFGFYQLGSITDVVWHDVNRDGLRTADEAPISGVTVKLLDPSGAVVATTTSAADGTYKFLDLVPGSYSVVFVIATLPPGFVPTTTGGADSTKNSDGDRVTGASAPVVVGPGSVVLDVALGAHLSQSDLAITKTAQGTARVTTGGIVTWHLSVTNNGVDPVAGPITITDTLPASLTFNSATGDFTCSSVGQDVTCTTAELMPVGKVLSVDIVTKVGAGTGAITNTASVKGTGTETVTANNVSSATIARAARLPTTGTSIGGLLMLGLALLGLGSVLVIGQRQRKTATR
jgi:uncharacterized repeat protein (TIGR01451 family)